MLSETVFKFSPIIKLRLLISGIAALARLFDESPAVTTDMVVLLSEL